MPPVESRSKTESSLVELESKDILIGFEKDYPKVVKESNINDILKTLKEKRKKQ